MTRQATQVPSTVTIGDDLTVGRVGHGAMQLTGPKQWGDYPDRSKAIALLREVVGIVFSPWHPGAVPGGEEGRPFHAVIDPIAERYGATAQQVALAWQLHRTEKALPIPGTTSAEHLRENLDAATIDLTDQEVDAITALAAEDS
jgi:aryl-alcohol dehydrogenase-like predicted oxidoreductase